MVRYMQNVKVHFEIRTCTKMVATRRSFYRTINHSSLHASVYAALCMHESERVERMKYVLVDTIIYMLCLHKEIFILNFA